MGRFLELMSYYLQSTFVEYEGSLYVQQKGVCIGSCLAPILSDLVLARCDRLLQAALQGSPVVKVFRFVDDFLIVFKAAAHHTCKLVDDVLGTFSTHLIGFELTKETPKNQERQFLGMKLHIEETHLCWSYAPRSKKALQPFASAHSKLVKRSVATAALKNALHRSCHHRISDSFQAQVGRLRSAGFPEPVLQSVGNRIWRELRTPSCMQEPERDNVKTAVMPYIHGVSHRLKKVVGRAGVRLVFSAPNKLSKMCARVNDGSSSTVIATLTTCDPSPSAGPLWFTSLR